MTTREACRGCDGRGERRSGNKENVFETKVTVCGRCNGDRKEPGPPKGGKRFFRRTPKAVDDGNDLGQAADAFLARHGYGKGGR